MKPKILLLTLGLFLLGSASLWAQGNSVIVYRGMLKTNGVAATGLYDMTGTLFTSQPPDGSPLTNSITLTNILVTDGNFTLRFDWGSGVWGSYNSWFLQVSVAKSGTVEIPQAILPRQEVTATPLAVYASKSASADSVKNGSITSVSLAPGAVTSSAIAPGAIGAGSIANGAVTGNTIANRAVTAANMATVTNLLPLTIPNPDPGSIHSFGCSVAGIGSDKFIVGAIKQYENPLLGIPEFIGECYLFRVDGTLLTTFTNIGHFPYVQGAGEYSFASVGSNAVVIANLTDNGAAYLYSLSGSLMATFTNPIPIPSPFGQSKFGRSVATLGSDRVLISDTYLTGRVNLYSTNGSYLNTFYDPNVAPFSHSHGFGYSVAALGTENICVSDTYGDVYLFSTNGTLVSTLHANGTESLGQTAGGSSIAAVGGETILIGNQTGYVGNEMGNLSCDKVLLVNTNGTILKVFSNPSPNPYTNFLDGVFYYDVYDVPFGGWLGTMGDNRVLIGTSKIVYLFNLDGTLQNTFTNPAPSGNSVFGKAFSAVGNDRAVFGDHEYHGNDGIVYLYNPAAYTDGLVSDTVRPGGVTTDSISNGAVDNSKITDRAVGASKIIDGAVIGTKIANGAVDTNKIASGQVVFSLNNLRDDVIIAAGTNVVLSTNGQTLTISSISSDVADANDWKLAGNNVSPGQFLGSTNAVALEVKAGGMRALRIEPNTNSAPNIIGGSENNFVGTGVMGAFIGGGGAVDFNGVAYTNSVSAVFGVVAGGGGNSTLPKAYFSAIGGGLINTIGAEAATIGGGAGNNIGEDSSRATIAGGNGNLIKTNSSSSTISGGELNSIGNRADWSTIGGGIGNHVQDYSAAATIPGGYGNSATNYAFAAGTLAKANHTGAFVWADFQATDFPSANTNEFAVRASGGVRLVTSGAGLTVDGVPINGIVSQLAGTYTNAVAFVNASNTFTGNGAGLTNVSAASLGGLSSSNYWQLGGNNVANGQFIGSTNNQPLELKVNSARALRIEPNTNGAPNIIGGSAVNYVNAGVVGATIGGGGAAIYAGFSHTNFVSGDFSTVGGGVGNSVTNSFGTVAGGYGNRAGGNYASVGGGLVNQAAGFSATVSGGLANTALGDYAFAAGRQAKANHQGVFIWADSQAVDFPSANTNEFAVRASGGVRLVTGGAGLTVDGQPVLAGLPANIAFVTSNQTFTASNIFAGAVTATNTSNTFAGTFSGNAGGLTNLNASQLATGPVPLAVLSGITSNQLNITTWQLATNLNGGNAALASNVLAGISITNVFITSSTFAGNGAGLTNLNVASLSTNIAFVNSNQTFTASNTFAGVVVATNLNNRFSGNGGGLTNLNPASLTSGTASISITGNAATANSATTAGNATTAVNLSGPLAGEVTGTQGATAVAFVSGMSASSVTNGAGAANAATSANTPNTIVKRDATGSFNAGSIVATNFVGNGAGLTNLNVSGLVASNAWTLNGNTGTDATTNFIGTTDNQPLHLAVAGIRALRLQPYSGNASIIGGFSGNVVSNGVTGAVIAGGGTSGFTNRVTDNYAVVGGGAGNTAGDSDANFNNGAYSVVAGGFKNNAAAQSSVVGGGSSNTNSGYAGVIAGGQSNRATNNFGIVAGGQNNLAGGWAAMVAGGEQNQALGGWSLAAGRNAQANHDGTFVWADTTQTTFTSTTTNQFLIRAQNGVGINTASPATALDVNGTATVTGFRLSTSPAAGAVLTSDASGNGSWATSITASSVTPNAVGTPGILDGAITGPKIADGSINTNDLSGQVLTNTFWRLTGNAGTDPATNFIGTTDNRALEVRVNNRRGLRLEPQTASVNVIGGDRLNAVDAGVVGATIAGGGNDATPFSFPNNVHGDYGTVGGGLNNEATNRATVGGGEQNAAGGKYATVPGGYGNFATDYSFAAGKQAKAIHPGSFVWADGGAGNFTTANSNTFIIRASGGVGIGVTNPLAGFALHVGGSTYVEGDSLVVRGSTGNEYPYLDATNNQVRLGSLGFGVNSVKLWNNSFGHSPGLMGLYASFGDFTTGVHMNNSVLDLSGSNDGLVYSTTFGAQTVNGPVLYGATNGALGVNGATPRVVLSWNNVGVAINTNNSGGASLYVQGNRTGGWGQPVAVCENISGGASSSPALLVQGNGNMVDGVLAVRNTGGGVLAQFGTALGWQVTFTTNGYIYAEGDVYARGVKLTSDRNAKENFTTLNAKTVLAKVAALPISEWKYKSEDGVRHIGPVAQDFQAAFQLSDDDKHISTVDEGGVALAAIQGLNQKLEEKDSEIRELKHRLEALEKMMSRSFRER